MINTTTRRSAAALLACALLACGCASGPALRQQAVAGQAADVGSTAIGLAMGAAEANPLGLATLGLKVAAHHHISAAPAEEQPAMWSAYGAFGWGATTNNLCVVAAIATGGTSAALCPLLGLTAGLGLYNADAPQRERATFDALCAKARASNPALRCIYTPPGTSTQPHQQELAQ